MDLNPGKSANDKKDYRILSLSSGLEVLLVSTQTLTAIKGMDAEDSKSAAAMYVEVGSFSDPMEAEGCAHFLEHMVFMGSSKYPKENEYDAFVTAHGGGCNAFTEGEYTVFQFDIQSEHFNKALDIFANCFIDPLLRMEASDREIQAIESEFSIASMNDEVRLQQLFSHHAQDGHVLRKFSWGNLNSLSTVPASKGVNIESILKSFHKTHYLPQNMKLVVVAPKSLDQLEASVNRSFGAWTSGAGVSVSSKKEGDAIAWLLEQDDGNEGKKEKSKKKSKKKDRKNVEHNNDGKDVDLPVLPTQPEILSQQVKGYTSPVWCPDPSSLSVSERSALTIPLTRVVPIVKAKHKLVIVWQLPAMRHEYRKKTNTYVGHLIGHEGEGSLIAHLKATGYCTGLSAGCDDSSNFDANSLFTLFRVHVSLTSLGLTNWISVAEQVFVYLNMLRSQGPQKWVFDELQKIARLDFDFIDEEDEEDVAERLSVEMGPLLARKREDLLSAAYLMWDWDEASIEACYNDLCPEKALISIVSSNYGKDDNNSDVIGEEKQEAEAETERGKESEDGDEEDDEEEESDGEKEEEEKEEEVHERLSPEQILHLYQGRPEWTSLVLPPFLSQDAVSALQERAMEESNGGEGKTTEELLPLIEPHFNVEYYSETIPASLLSRWIDTYYNGPLASNSCQRDDTVAVASPYHLPAPNPFVPDDLSILPVTNVHRSDTGRAVSPVYAANSSSDGTKISAGKGNTSNNDPADEEMLRKKLRIEADPIPSQILQVNGLSLWHMLDPRFPVPKATLAVRLVSPAAYTNAKSSCLNELMKHCLYDSLEKSLYVASTAELVSSFSSHSHGIDIKIAGFSDKVLILGKLILEQLMRPQSFVTESSFKMQSDKMRRTYQNFGMKSSNVANSARLYAIKPSIYSPLEKVKYLPLEDHGDSESNTTNTTGLKRERSASVTSTTSNAMRGLTAYVSEEHGRITMEDLIAYTKDFFAHMAVEALVHGNISEGDAKDMLFDILQNAPSVQQHISVFNIEGGKGSASLDTSACSINLDDTAYGHADIMQVPVGNVIILKQSPRNPKEPSICVECYYQYGLLDTTSMATLDLLETLLYEPFFDSLRTKQQLGYSVNCSTRSTYGVVGFLFSVTSSAFDVPAVLASIMKFIGDIPTLIERMKGEEYKEYVDSLITDKIQPPNNIFDAANANYSVIQDRRYDSFDVRLQEVMVIKKLQKQHMISFCQELFGVNTRRMMVIEVSMEKMPTFLEDCDQGQQKVFHEPTQLFVQDQNMGSVLQPWKMD